MFLTKRKNNYWYVGWYENSRLRFRSTKTKLKAKANEKFRNFKNKDRCQIVYLSNLEREVIKYIKIDLSNQTIDIYKRCFKNLMKILSDKPIENYSIRDMEKYKSLRIKTVKKTSVNIEVRCIKTIFQKAVHLGFLESNPLRGLKQFEIPEQEILAFDEKQIKQILDKCCNKIKDIVIFALYTGMRLNEILHLQWNDIDFENRSIKIVNKDTHTIKNKKNENIPLNIELISLLQKMKINNINGYLWNLKKDNVSKIFKKLLKSLHFHEKYHFHCLRHTFITNMARQGVSPLLIMKIARHSDLSTTMRYVHFMGQDLHSAVNSVSYKQIIESKL
jgi:integrase